ncbi:hypothetical protein ACFXJ8_16385 [Nonomuraea sp. NPDC059194]|uniref:hypothetical protein n=1 Tax=Nonomuraea sp. NPDC059194 TaxID=3346764 RepID=UPI0036A0FED5
MTRWMTWAPWGAMVGALAYGGVQAYWAVGHAPAWVLGYDVTFPSWAVVALCAGVVLVVAGLRASGGRLPLVLAAYALGVALVAASAVLLLDVVGGILPGLGIPRDLPAFLSRAGCASVGLLAAATGLSWQRRRTAGCLRCVGVPRLDATPRWGYVAAYAAVAGCLVRIVAQLTMGVDIPYAASPSLLIFEFGFLLAGVLLPHALVHGWGKVWPRWVVPLAGRRVPRWLVMGPGFAISAAMLAYFGTGVTQMVRETVDGTLQEPAFMWVAVPAYVVWGLGLAVASVSYYLITRPACASCGR